MNREKLLEILKKVKPGISDKTIVESMTYFYFSGKEIITYNDKISIMHPLETEFNLFVKADDMFKIVSFSKAEELKLTEKENFLNVRTANMNVNLTTIVDEEIVERMDIIRKSIEGIKKWKKLPDNFMECAYLCSFAASKQEAESTISSLYFNKKICMATDNDRFASAVMAGPVDTMFLKASQLSNLSSIEPALYSITKAWIHFINGEGCIFSIRRIAGDFPDLTSELTFKGRSVKLSTNILEGADLASIFVDSLEPKITIKITKGQCLISVKSEGGGAQHRTKITYEGPEIKFTLNPEFLKEMLAHSTTVTIDDESRKAKLSTENFTMLTSLHSSGV